MIPLDWGALALGLAAGVGTATAFFVGLGYGMRIALRTKQTVNILVLSAFVRIAALLGIGWAVTVSIGPFGFLGFGLGFFIARRVATAIARAGAPVEGAP